jgi:hypothetical protein
MAKLLPTVEAFRARLQAKYPDRTDLLQINSADQLVYAKRFELQDLGPAHEVLATIRADVASGKLRLRGVLESGMPDDIEIDHRKRGNLAVFDGTLTIEDKDKLGFTHQKIYRHVYVYADDMPKANLKPRPRRGAPVKYDWPAIQEFTSEQLDTRGDFADEDQMDGWKTYADLYRAIEERFGERCPELTTLKERVPAFVDEWRAVKAGN